MITAIALVDLDDTLFQTRRKCPSDVTEGDLTAMAFDRAGAPSSFAVPQQKAMIEWLLASALVVPVTGRSRDALSRVALPHDYAVAAHGGVVLRPGGELCGRWATQMATDARAHSAELERLSARCVALAQDHGGAISVRIIGEQDTGLYVVAKHHEPALGEPDLHQLARAVGAELCAGWTLHVNGNNVAMLPPFLGKRQAAEFLLNDLRALHPGLPVVGLGDSLTDAPFMQLCDFAMIPSGSQLAGQVWQRMDSAQ